MDDLYGQIGAILTLLISVGGVGAGTWFTVELLKNVVNIIGGSLPGSASIQLGGNKTWLVAAFISAGYVLGLDINLLGDFASFDGIDAELLKTVNAALLAIGANTWHDRVFGAA